MTFAHRVVAGGVAACALLFAGEASAQQTIRLTVAAGSPITVTPAKMTKEVFIPEINKRLAASDLKVKIEWTEAYNQTLAKFNEVFEAVEEGVAHVGVLLTNFEESKLPLEQYGSAIPFGISEPRAMQKADQRIRSKVPEMDAHFTKYNQVVLAHSAGESQQMFTKFPLTKLEDLNGHKIGGSGALGLVIRGTDAVLVTASMASSYTDIANGVYEGYVINESLAHPYKTYQAAPYFTRTDFGCSTVGAISVNKKTWDGFPTAVKDIFHQAAQAWTDQYILWEEKKIIEARAAMAKEGVKSSVLPAAEREKWAKRLPNLAKEWVDAVEKQGLPAKRILTAYMDEVRASVGKPVREWDKE
jgi:TRAP-type transport system periplasmic protein